MLVGLVRRRCGPEPSRSAAVLRFRRMSSLVILVSDRGSVHASRLGKHVCRVTQLRGLDNHRFLNVEDVFISNG